MKSFLIAYSIIAIACSCNNEAVQTDTSKSDTAVSEVAPSIKNEETDTVFSGCYSMIIARDTASLQIQKKGPLVTGSLSYNLFEKDRNDGTFEGELNNNVLIGWYLFRSEGLMSVRQVAWQVDGNKLYPGFGEIIVRKDSSMFVKPDQLKFDRTRPFVKVKCLI